MKNETMNKTKKTGKEIYARIRCFNPFRARFAFVDSPNGNGILNLFNQYEISARIECGWANEVGLRVTVITIPKKRIDDFLRCMEHHEKNSLILGWGLGEDFETTVQDMHEAAGA